MRDGNKTQLTHFVFHNCIYFVTFFTKIDYFQVFIDVIHRVIKINRY